MIDRAVVTHKMLPPNSNEGACCWNEMCNEFCDEEDDSDSESCDNCGRYIGQHECSHCKFNCRSCNDTGIVNNIGGSKSQCPMCCIP